MCDECLGQDGEYSSQCPLKNQHEMCVCVKSDFMRMLYLRKQRLKVMEGEGINSICHKPHRTYFFIVTFYCGVIFRAESFIFESSQYSSFCKSKKLLRGYNWYNTRAVLTDCYL